MATDRLSNEVLDVFSGVCYAIRPDGTILSVGPANWDRITELGNAPEVSADAVIGRNIFDFLQGDDVVEGLRSILGRLAEGEFSEWVMPYRCDSPAVERRMRLSISAVRTNGKVDGYLFQSVPLSEDERPPMNLFDFQSLAAHMAELKGRAMLVMCSWCQRVKDSATTDGQFIEATEYYRLGGTDKVSLSHTICPDCRERQEKGYVKR